MRKIIGWRLVGVALLVSSTFLTAPAAEAYCCSCDYSNSYHYCLEGCGSDQACQSNCWDQWAAAEDRCIRMCPYGAVC
jgi:hypothetical protein